MVKDCFNHVFDRQDLLSNLDVAVGPAGAPSVLGMQSLREQAVMLVTRLTGQANVAAVAIVGVLFALGVALALAIRGRDEYEQRAAGLTCELEGAQRDYRVSQ